MTVRITKWFLVSVVILVAGYTLCMVSNDTPGDTVSEVVLRYALDWATIPFVWGVVTGHFFWPTKCFRFHWAKVIWLIYIVFTFILWDAADLYNVHPLIPVVLGIVVGAMLWPIRGMPAPKWKK